GFGVMAAELTAVRLLAPHFGDSAYVWTNVIGVILAAMALGATLGGRLSARDSAPTWPFRLLLVGGVLLAVAPFLTRWLGGALLPDDLPLDAAMPVLIRGSLVATAVVFAPPLLLLAAVSPLLIVLLARRGTGLGRAAGDVAAAGTVGSLVGTFAATHWLVPSLGCRLALLVAAGVLLLAALLVAPRRRRAAGAGAMVLVALSALLHGGPLRPVGAGGELLAERETPYQFLQVQRHEVGGATRTTLVINEGLDSHHSLAVKGSAFTGGAYYDWHGIAPLLAVDGGDAAGVRALSIGDAAGTLRQVYAALYPGVTVDAVDIDPATMALGDEFFTQDKAAGRRFAIDGRQFVEHAAERWDVIHVDAYAHQVYVPAHLASREFFAAARERLTDGGVLACNVGALTLDDPVLQAIAATVGDVFDEVRAFQIPRTRNAL
ncbi:MAG: fused MFS/spermidine synthase, partial [Planctomycetes bacterium]|nr:fused MFS/spermidine synthase [Planctomycetota bacterium]